MFEVVDISPSNLDSPCDSSSPAFHMMYSAYKLSKLGNNVQPWHTPFPFLNQSIVSCSVLTIVSWPVYRFLRWQLRWSAIPVSKNFPQFVVIHTVKGCSVVKEREVDGLLEFLCFFYDPVDVGNWISGSSAFTKSNLYIWNFSIHILLKPSLKDFEHYLASMWNEHNCTVVEAFFGIAFLCDWNEKWPFPVLWPLLSFPNLLTYWVQHFNSIIF